MDYLGKILVRYGDIEMVGDRYACEIPEHLFNNLVEYARPDILENILKTQIEFENYEAAAILRDKLKSLKGE